MSEPVVICGGGDGEWNATLVALSCLVAVGGSFAALDCADRMHAATSRRIRSRYFLAGATLMGVSIWTMHFVGMLALRLGVPINYDPGLSTVSIAAAAFGAGLAFLIVNGRTVTRFHVVFGGVAMGVAIASMHYLGMASMRMPATIRYDPPLFAASIGIAIAASSGALGLARLRIGSGQAHFRVKSFSAVAMGVAIAGMHYVGMAAARYAPGSIDSTIAGEQATVGPWSLQDVLVVAGLVIAIALLALAAKNAAERQLALESLEEKRAEAVAASRAKDAFLASLSHELRTPLNPALLLASDAATNSEFSLEAREAFSSIARSITLEARLIDDLLDLTRISRGLLKIEPRVVDVHAVLQDAIAVVKPGLRERNLKLAVEFGATETHTYGDSDRLQQVFWNLLQNAAKFSHDGGRIDVSTRSDGATVEVLVTDAGIGMTDAELARCFEAFQQGDHKRGGLGLGLSISRSIVELHGGSMIARSPGPAHGAAFSVVLKAAPAPTEKKAEAPELATIFPSTTRKLKVLLVEDHEPSRTTMERLLARRGHDVTAVGTVQDALRAAESHVFDLLVSDIGLPDGSGHDLMRALRASRNIVGIAVTGYGMEEDVRNALRAGFAAHLSKPVNHRRLDEAITSVLGSSTAHATGTPLAQV